MLQVFEPLGRTATTTATTLARVTTADVENDDDYGGDDDGGDDGDNDDSSPMFRRGSRSEARGSLPPFSASGGRPWAPGRSEKDPG